MLVAIAFFSRKLNSAQKNNTTKEKELLSIVETLKEFRNILFRYQNRVFSDYKNFVHSATVSQSQRVVRGRLILGEFVPDIQHISEEDNIVADAMSRLPTITEDQQELCTVALDPTRMEMFILDEEISFPLVLSLVQKTQNIELNKRNSKRKQLVNDKASKYNIMEFDSFTLVTYEKQIYVPVALRQHNIELYLHYLDHPGGERLYKTFEQVCYWKGMTSQCINFCKKIKDCQKHKPRKSKYRKVPPMNIGVLKPWNTVHVDLIGPYSLNTQQY